MRPERILLSAILLPAVALAQLGADASDCVYVGDSEIDADTAKAAGMPCLLVTWGFRSRQELENGAPWKIVDTVQQLEEALLAER